jgi:hypothetical protein
MVNARPLALAAALLAACAGGGASAPRVAPALAAAEPLPLEAGFLALRARFDADAARARLLVLASPT